MRSVNHVRGRPIKQLPNQVQVWWCPDCGMIMAVPMDPANIRIIARRLGFHVNTYRDTPFPHLITPIYLRGSLGSALNALAEEINATPDANGDLSNDFAVEQSTHEKMDEIAGEFDGLDYYYISEPEFYRAFLEKYFDRVAYRRALNKIDLSNK